MNILAFIKERAKHYKCPACARYLESCDVRMLEQAESHLTVEVTCARCHVTFHVMLGVHSATERELSEEAAYVPPVGEPITDDEILDVHEMLRNFRGNFRDLLRSGEPNAN